MHSKADSLKADSTHSVRNICTELFRTFRTEYMYGIIPYSPPSIHTMLYRHRQTHSPYGIIPYSPPSIHSLYSPPSPRLIAVPSLAIGVAGLLMDSDHLASWWSHDSF